MKGFLVAADAIVPCKTCGAAEGVPCKGLKRNYVHIGRRISRLLLSAGSPHPEKRAEFEAAAVKELQKYLRERARD
jgi:hypothetical protein